ncbi:MAG: ribosome maturation factor RimM [Anaerolineae bacterium]
MHDSRSHDCLIIGQIVAPRGVRGELRVHIITDAPDRFLDLESVFVGPELIPHKVRRARLHKQWALLEFEGINDRDAAEELRGQMLSVSRQQAIPLAEDEYFVCDIVGLLVVTDADDELGRVTEVISTGANDVYVVRTATGDLLLPAIRDVVLAIDIDAGLMRVRVPDGLS